MKGVQDRDRVALVFQLRNSFGGYCDNRSATESAFGSGTTRNPWRDAGCLPGAPTDRPHSPATGAPVISGTAQVGETLTADTSGISDSDGLANATFSYQWLADDAEIEGATDSSYTLTDDEVGKTIKVKVSFSDNGDNEESLTSAATAQVTARPNSPATGEPTISGTAQAGQMLTANISAITDADGLDNVSYSYQWLADDADIDGATGSTYTLTDDEVGKTIKVKVSFTDDRDNEERLASAATVSVAARPNNPATGAPTISGTAQVGSELTASTSGISDADGLDNVDFAYQWLAGGSDISGATGSSYTLTDGEVGKAIKVKVSFTDDANNQETLTSAATPAVAAAANSPATGSPTISGTAQVGEDLTASTSDIADADGMDNPDFSYKWLADDAEIQGATGASYTLTDDEVGKTIKVRVSFSDDKNNQESLTSAATIAVTAAPGASEHLRVNPHDAQGLDVLWETPADDGGSPVTGYRVQWKEATGSWDTPSDVSEATVTGNTHTINGLTEVVEYAVRVIAVNGVGDGPPSDQRTGTPRETIPPELVSSGLRVDGATLTLAYDEALDGDSVPAVDAFVVKVVTKGDSFTWQDERARREVASVAVSGSAVELTLAEAVTSGQQVVLSYTPPTDETAPRIRDVAGNAAAGFPGMEVANDTVEASPPQLDTAGVDRATLTLAYNEALDGDSVPAADAFTVEVGTVERGVDGVSVAGSVVTLTLASAVGAGDTVTVSYTAPSEESASPIQDLAGNATPSFSGQAVNNDTKPPLTASHQDEPESHDGETVFTFELHFSEEFDLSYKVLRDHAFTVTGGKVTKAKRAEPGVNKKRVIHVKPDGDGAVTILLPITTDCQAQGAICTGDGRMLSNQLEFTVAGPSQ